jgi:hypothetical protein
MVKSTLQRKAMQAEYIILLQWTLRVLQSTSPACTVLALPASQIGRR